VDIFQVLQACYFVAMSSKGDLHKRIIAQFLTFFTRKLQKWPN
jgi:hypothetical protein